MIVMLTYIWGNTVFAAFSDLAIVLFICENYWLQTATIGPETKVLWLITIVMHPDTGWTSILTSHFLIVKDHGTILAVCYSSLSVVDPQTEEALLTAARMAGSSSKNGDG